MLHYETLFNSAIARWAVVVSGTMAMVAIFEMKQQAENAARRLNIAARNHQPEPLVRL